MPMAEERSRQKELVVKLVSSFWTGCSNVSRGSDSLDTPFVECALHVQHRRLKLKLTLTSMGQ